jgi:glycosyltransferase involved in cell wall biosynthesis
MRVLMLAPEPFFQPRGTPISIHFRIKALADLGHKTDLVTYPLGEDLAFKDFTILRVPNVLRLRKIKIGPSLAKLPLDGLMVIKTLATLLRGRYDVIFSHEEAGWFGAFFGKLFRIPHIYDMHSSLPQQLENFNFSKSKILKGIFDALERFVLRNSKVVIVICRDLLDYVQSHGFGAKAVFLENFMDFADFEAAPPTAEAVAEVRRAVAPGGEKIVLYAGNFEPYQGIPLLIEAFARVKSKAVLLIVGGVKAEHDAARKMAEKLGAGGRIAFVEKVAPRKVPLYVAASDVLVSPRVSGTNTPLKIYSFLKSGKPFVATKLWTHTQVMDEKVSVLADPDPKSLAEGLIYALESEGAQQRAREAKRRADRDYVYPRYLEKITEALNKATRVIASD